jgi:hypothetical protein
MLERDISRNDVRNVIFTGEIIEDYPLDEEQSTKESLPSCLILGLKLSEAQKIHVVLGYNGKKILLISAYYPDMIHWNEDCKTRRS